MTPAQEEYTKLETILAKHRAHPQPPPLDACVGSAFLAGNVTSDVAEQGGGDAGDAKADDVQSARNTADGTSAQLQDAPPASVDDAAPTSAPVAETQVSIEEQEDKAETPGVLDGEEETRTPAMPQCIKCQLHVDLVANKYVIMNMCRAASSDEAAELKVKCNLCNAKESQLRRIYGAWPPKSFLALATGETGSFWRDCGEKGVEAAVMVHLVQKRLNEEMQRYGGGYAPIGVLEKLGYEPDVVKANCTDTWTDPEQLWLGLQYRVKQLTISSEERLVREEQLMDSLRDELAKKKRAGGGKKKGGATEEEEKSQSEDEASDDAMLAKERTPEEIKQEDAAKKLAAKARIAAERLAEKKRQKEADIAEKAGVKEEQKRRKIETDQFKKNKVDGQKVMAVLKPCIAQMEKEKMTVGFGSIDNCMREPVEKRLAELKSVVAEILVASVEVNPAMPPWTVAKAKDMGKKSVTMAKSAASFIDA